MDIKNLPAPFMIDEQHRMVTWFESMFIPVPELLVNLVIFTEVIGGIGIILGGLIGFIASQLGHLITRASAFSLFLLMIGVFSENGQNFNKENSLIILEEYQKLREISDLEKKSFNILLRAAAS